MTSDNDRLRAVFLKRSKISQREFGERYGIGTAGMVNQLLLGRRPVSLAAAVKFAEGLAARLMTSPRNSRLSREKRLPLRTRLKPILTARFIRTGYRC